MSPSVLALDVGGANLKAAHSTGIARLRPFELWKQPAALPDALRDLLKGMPGFDCLAVTMTGELCDCFATRREGVHTILDAVAAVAGQTPVQVWRNDGQLVDVATARAAPLQTAAANWLALGAFAGRFAPRGPGLLIDIGSTTTDLVPLEAGRPVPRGRTDSERLRCGELLYTGVRRTPACALLGARAAAELFATTLDVYLILDALPEDPADGGTADGRPATRAAAHARLARMLCADAETCTLEETRQLALRAAQRQVYHLEQALRSSAAGLSGPAQTIVLAGSGEFLARAMLRTHADLVDVPVVSLAEQLGPDISRAACAYALAVIAAERGDTEA